jgi:hypothetical protein
MLVSNTWYNHEQQLVETVAAHSTIFKEPFSDAYTSVHITCGNAPSVIFDLEVD